MLAEPEVRACEFDEAFYPGLGVMLLDWPKTGSNAAERSWPLPGGVVMAGSPPIRFGISIQRWDHDRYAVCLQWNETSLRWSSLSRADLARTCLVKLLADLGTDLYYLLDQPIMQPECKLRRAA
jgi:hypothetical protein